MRQIIMKKSVMAIPTETATATATAGRDNHKSVARKSAIVLVCVLFSVFRTSRSPGRPVLTFGPAWLTQIQLVWVSRIVFSISVFFFISISIFFFGSGKVQCLHTIPFSIGPRRWARPPSAPSLPPPSGLRVGHKLWMSFLHFCFEVNRKIFKANSHLGQLKGQLLTKGKQWASSGWGGGRGGWKKVCQDRNQCQDLFIVPTEQFVQLTGFSPMALLQIPKNYVIAGLSLSGWPCSHPQAVFLACHRHHHSLLIALSSICRFNQHAISSNVTKPVVCVSHSHGHCRSQCGCRHISG